MSQIFDVVADKSGVLQVLSERPGSSIRFTKLIQAGPNRVEVPTFKVRGADYHSEHKLRQASSELSSEELMRRDRVMVPYNTSVNSQDMLQLVSMRLQNTEYRGKGAITLQPRNLIKHNSAIYYLSLKAIEPVTLNFLNFTVVAHGDIEMYSYDQAILTFQAISESSRQSLVVAYSQILPVKDSLIRILSRAQYA